MKRITYISRLLLPISLEEIEQIGIVSSQNNVQNGITGLLVYFEKLFFQIIEGDSKKVDQLFSKIGKDGRHTDVLRLKTEDEVEDRLFPSWSMKVINLDNNADDLMHPIKILLQTVTESHSIIERYTQPAILKILNRGINPLTVLPQRKEKIIVFADIISYSAITEKMTIENVLLILNTYFEISSRIILNRGGQVNKFLGDGLMAYFDVEQADDAIQSCLDIMGELRGLRREAGSDSPLRLLNSVFGLAQGTVIEGNMGSNFKTDYTIIGDAVNTAARLEGLTRELKCSILISELLKQHTKKAWKFMSLGHYYLKGQEKNSEVFTIDHELVNEYKENIFVQ